MDMENDVIRLAGELSVAVEVIMDPNVSQQARMDAYIACEKYDDDDAHLMTRSFNNTFYLISPQRFKDMSPFCAQAGLYLASGPFSANIRHFGLQLMEHTVKFKWNCISQEEKIFIKVSNESQSLYRAFGF